MFICIIALRRVSFKPYIVLIKAEFCQYISLYMWICTWCGTTDLFVVCSWVSQLLIKKTHRNMLVKCVNTLLEFVYLRSIVFPSKPLQILFLKGYSQICRPFGRSIAATIQPMLDSYFFVVVSHGATLQLVMLVSNCRGSKVTSFVRDIGAVLTEPWINIDLDPSRQHYGQNP